MIPSCPKCITKDSLTEEEIERSAIPVGFVWNYCRIKMVKELAGFFENNEEVLPVYYCIISDQIISYYHEIFIKTSYIFRVSCYTICYTL